MSMLLLLIWIFFYYSRHPMPCFCTILSKLLLFQSLSTCSRIPPSHESFALSRGISRALLHSQSCSLALACSRRAPAKVAHFFSHCVFSTFLQEVTLTSPASVSQPKSSACDLCFYNRISRDNAASLLLLHTTCLLALNCLAVFFVFIILHICLLFHPNLFLEHV